MLKINSELFKFKLEPIVSLYNGSWNAFEILSTPLNPLVNPQRFFDGLHEYTLSSIFIRQLETFQKLNGQDKSRFFSIFINLNPIAVGKWLSWEDFVPFIFQFEINVEIDAWKACRDLTSTSIKALSKLKTMGVKLWLDDVDHNYHQLPSELIDLFDGIKLDKYFVWQCVKNNDTTFISYLSSVWGAENIIAEGIESESILYHSRTHGIGLGQGFLWEKIFPVFDGGSP